MTRRISCITGAMKSPRRSSASDLSADRKGTATGGKPRAGPSPAAVHEASHAVVAVLLGMKARAVLHADEPGCGATDIEAPEGPTGAECLLVALVAGGEGEGRLLDQVRQWHVSTDDAKAMLRIVGGLTTPGAAARLARAKRTAADLVRRPEVWRAIEDVSRRLQKRSEVPDADVRDAVVAAGLTPQIV